MAECVCIVWGQRGDDERAVRSHEATQPFRGAVRLRAVENNSAVHLVLRPVVLLRHAIVVVGCETGERRRIRRRATSGACRLDIDADSDNNDAATTR